MAALSPHRYTDRARPLLWPENAREKRIDPPERVTVTLRGHGLRGRRPRPRRRRGRHLRRLRHPRRKRRRRALPRARRRLLGRVVEVLDAFAGPRRGRPARTSASAAAASGSTSPTSASSSSSATSSASSCAASASFADQPVSPTVGADDPLGLPQPRPLQRQAARRGRLRAPRHATASCRIEHCLIADARDQRRAAEAAGQGAAACTRSRCASASTPARCSIHPDLSAVEPSIASGQQLLPRRAARATASAISGASFFQSNTRRRSAWSSSCSTGSRSAGRDAGRRLRRRRHLRRTPRAAGRARSSPSRSRRGRRRRDGQHRGFAQRRILSRARWRTSCPSLDDRTGRPDPRPAAPGLPPRRHRRRHRLAPAAHRLRLLRPGHPRARPAPPGRRRLRAAGRDAASTCSRRPTTSNASQLSPACHPEARRIYPGDTGAVEHRSGHRIPDGLRTTVCGIARLSALILASG